MSKALIVCDAPKGTAFYQEFLLKNGYEDITVVEDGNEARRKLVELDYDICLVNAPLRQENGEQLSIDIAEKNICQVLLFVKAEYIEETTENVENFGVITVSKPISKQMFWTALKLAKVTQRRIDMAREENSKLQKKLESIKVVSHAKLLLISYENMSEEEAHKYIEHYAMDNRMTRLEVAREIIDKYE